MSEEKKPKNKALDNLWMALRRETRLKIFCQPVVKKYLSNPKLFKKNMQELEIENSNEIHSNKKSSKLVDKSSFPQLIAS